MKKLLIIASLFLSLNLWANLYNCSGAGYKFNIANPNNVPANNPAMVISSADGISKVLARDLSVSAGFEIDISGRTVSGFFVQYASLSIDDPGVANGQKVSGKMTLDTRRGNIKGKLVCVRGNSNLP